jgi:hypothetical protein
MFGREGCQRLVAINLERMLNNKQLPPTDPKDMGPTSFAS